MTFTSRLGCHFHLQLFSLSKSDSGAFSTISQRKIYNCFKIITETAPNLETIRGRHNVQQNISISLYFKKFLSHDTKQTVPDKKTKMTLPTAMDIWQRCTWMFISVIIDTKITCHNSSETHHTFK